MVTIPSETFAKLKEEKQNRIIEASINEFATRSFGNAKLSNIIKEAKIPRGSFYQYFEDKMDLYLLIFDKIAERKLEYMEDLLPNSEELSFLDLFYELYKRGAMFAIDNPKYVKITEHLMKSKDQVYNEIVGKNLDIARQFYIGFIEKDKELGRIDKGVDSRILADIVIDMTANVAFDEVQETGEIMDFDGMKEKIKKIIYIFRKGIETGE